MVLGKDGPGSCRVLSLSLSSPDVLVSVTDREAFKVPRLHSFALSSKLQANNPISDSGAQ